LQTEAQTVVPNLNIKDNSQFNIIGETELKASGSITVDTGAKLTIDGTAGYGREVYVGKSFIHKGLVEMNLFGSSAQIRILRGFALTSAEDSSYDSGDSDLINVDGGNIKIEESSRLNLKTKMHFLMIWKRLSGEHTS